MLIHFMIADLILFTSACVAAVLEHIDKVKQDKQHERNLPTYRIIKPNNPSYEVFKRRAV